MTWLVERPLGGADSPPTDELAIALQTAALVTDTLG